MGLMADVGEINILVGDEVAGAISAELIEKGQETLFHLTRNNSNDVSEKKYTKEDIFLDCVKEYIIKLEEIYIEHNKDVPQLEPLLTLYKKLI